MDRPSLMEVHLPRVPNRMWLNAGVKLTVVQGGGPKEDIVGDGYSDEGA